MPCLRSLHALAVASTALLAFAPACGDATANDATSAAAASDSEGEATGGGTTATASATSDTTGTTTTTASATGTTGSTTADASTTSTTVSTGAETSSTAEPSTTSGTSAAATTAGTSSTTDPSSGSGTASTTGGPTIDPVRCEVPGPLAADPSVAPLVDACALDPAASDPYADCVARFVPAAGVNFGHAELPDIVLGPPAPASGGTGGLDVASLGCGGEIALGFGGDGIVDGPGPDFVVFENPFVVGSETFTEPATVSVSDDGETWFTYPCALAGAATWPPTCCAGVNPVAPEAADPLALGDLAAVGGDAFDLAPTGLARARWVRLRDAGPAYDGSGMWCGGAAGGFDLDAIATRPSVSPDADSFTVSAIP
jgi:hypothetical protein